MTGAPRNRSHGVFGAPVALPVKRPSIQMRGTQHPSMEALPHLPSLQLSEHFAMVTMEPRYDGGA